MEFIRRGAREPNDFGDRIAFRLLAPHVEEKHETPQGRLVKLFDTYKDKDKLVILVDAQGKSIESTPIILREYSINGNVSDVGYGIGRFVNAEDPEVVLVVVVGDQTHLTSIPENGYDDVPETHGVPELLGWMEDRYPQIHPIKS